MNEEVEKSVLSLRENSSGIHRSNQMGSWHSPIDTHKLPEFSDFAFFVTRCVREVFNDWGYSGEPWISTMWCNVNPRNSYNKSHIHPESLISGIYYIRTPKDCGRLRLFNPNIHARMISDSRKSSDHPIWNESEIVYDPSPRKIIMFPSEILHEVEPNLNDEYDIDDPRGWRISIAFNCSQRVHDRSDSLIGQVI